uniref:Filamin binding LIM protein 1 n=1 Tax=Sphenodon punctatus TaxID=8508 RepID=A0A8D0G4A4_SPHPU
MLAGKVEKRIASSVYITLAPPKREPIKREIRQEASLLPCPSPSPLSSPQCPYCIKNSTAMASSLLLRTLTCFPSSIPPQTLPPVPSPESPPAPSSHRAPLLLVQPPLTTQPPPPTDRARFRNVSPQGPSQAAAPPTSKAPPPHCFPSSVLWFFLSDICAFCHKAILPQAPTVEAMNKQYHADCFTCRTCHCQLVGQRYYQKEGRPMCGACYQNTLEKCAKCQAVILEHIVRAIGNGYHPECFTCTVCHRTIGDESFALDDHNKVHCVDDFYRKYASVCSACEKPIIPKEGRDAYKIECLGRNFHENCYRCESCRIPLSTEPTENGCYPLNSHLFCKACHIRQKTESSC